MGDVPKEVDEWLDKMTKLLAARDVEENTSDLLANSVQGALDKIGVGRLQQMTASQVLVAVKEELPKQPNFFMLRDDFVVKSADKIAKMVEDYFTKHKIRSADALQSLGDGVLNELEARIAEYVAQLPKGVQVKRDGFTLVLTKSGAAASLGMKKVDLSADVNTQRTKLKLDTKELQLALEVKDGTVRFDGKLHVLRDGLDMLVKLEALRGDVKGDEAREKALDVKIEVTYEELAVQAHATLKAFETQVKFAAEEKGLKELSAQLKTDYEKFEAQVKAVFEKKDLKLKGALLATGEKLEGKIEASGKVAKGAYVNGEVKASLESFHAALEVISKQKDHDTKLVASLKTKYGKDLEAKAKLIHEAKTNDVRVKLVAEFSATLEKAKAAIELSVATDSWRLAAGGSIDSKGQGTAHVQALAKLGEGIDILGTQPYLNVRANLNDKQYNIFVGISLIKPAKAKDVAKVFDAAEKNIGKAYRVLEGGVPSPDGTALVTQMHDALRSPLPPAQLEVDFGVQITGNLPNAEIPSLTGMPAVTAGITIRFP